MRRPLTPVRKLNSQPEYLDLYKYDIVEFPDNFEQYRFAVIHGGFGCSTYTTGTKIFATFAPNIETAVQRESDDSKKSMSERMNQDWHGFTRRQRCIIRGHYNNGRFNPTLQENEP